MGVRTTRIHALHFAVIVCVIARMLIVNELGSEVRLQVTLEAVGLFKQGEQFLMEVGIGLA